jgi:hypothetical protein
MREAALDFVDRGRSAASHAQEFSLVRGNHLTDGGDA